jgi:hypothetical protein
MDTDEKSKRVYLGEDVEYLNIMTIVILVLDSATNILQLTRYVTHDGDCLGTTANRVSVAHEGTRLPEQ